MQMPFSERKHSPGLLLAGQGITPPSAASQLPGFACPGRGGREEPALRRHKPPPPFPGRTNPKLGHSAGTEGEGHWGLLPRRPQNPACSVIEASRSPRQHAWGAPGGTGGTGHPQRTRCCGSQSLLKGSAGVRALGRSG